MSKILNVLLVNGHGKETFGKRSPDDSFKEYQFARHVVAGIIGKLEDNPKFKCYNIVPEDSDITLTNRVKRINEKCSKFGAENCVVLEVHVNALGDGTKWMSGKGWQCHTTRGETNSDKLAECLYDAAEDIL
jgi:N-acetylmuramoyl-L-alanine amidase